MLDATGILTPSVHGMWMLTQILALVLHMARFYIFLFDYMYVVTPVIY